MRYSITILCWLYHRGKDGPIFSYGVSNWGVFFWVSNGQANIGLQSRDGSLLGSLEHTVQFGSWTFVGASYNGTSGKMKLWVDGIDLTLSVGAMLDLATQYIVRMGATNHDVRYFKGKITQMQIYNRALTSEELQAIRNQIAGKMSNSIFFILPEFCCSARSTVFLRCTLVGR